MKITHQVRYDAPADAVLAMLLDPEFRERVADAQHVVRRSVTVEGTTVTVRRAHAADGVPSFAAKFVGSEIEIVQTEVWSGQRAEVTVTIPGKPGEMTGTARLDADGERTVESIDLTVTVRVPLVGGKIEKLVAGLMEKAFVKEHEVGAAWLAERSRR